MEKMLIFPLKYVFDVDKTVSFATREVSFEGQNKQIQQLSTNPMKSWNITVRGTPQERVILESFFEKVGGNTRPFVFMDERNRPRWCRFADSKLSINEKRDFSNHFNPQGDVVGFEAKIVIELAQSEADENADTAEAEALWAKRFKGEDGAIFLPHISPSGLLTWTNDKGLPNPEPRQTIAIKGDQGITFRPSVDPKTADLSWTNDGGLQNPATVNVRGFTFTPSVSSDGTISWSNDGNLTNPSSVNVRGATFTPSVSDDGTISWTNDKGKSNPSSVNVRGATFTPSVSEYGVLSWTNDKGKNNPSPVNVCGATFTPSVDSNGNLSWTNDKGLDNPPIVNIKGDKGDAPDNVLQSGLDDKWDAQSKVIKNVAPPANLQDAVNKEYADSNFISKTGGVVTGILELQNGLTVTGVINGTSKEAQTAKDKEILDTSDSIANTRFVHSVIDSKSAKLEESISTLEEKVTTNHNELLSKISNETTSIYDTVGKTYLQKNDAKYTYLPLDGGTITGDLTVNGSINGTATKALTADTQENTDNSTKVATTEFVQNVTQEKVSEESNKIHQLVENTFNGLNTGLTETKGNLATLSQYVGNQSTTTWERQKVYAVGDIVYSSKLPPGYYLECTKSGRTDATEPFIPSDLSTGGGVLTDGTCTFAVKNTYSKLNIVTPPVEAIGSEVVNAEWVNGAIQDIATGTTTYEIVGDWRVMKTPCDNRLFVKLVTETLPVMLNYCDGEVGFGEGRVTINFPFPLDELMYSIPYISRGGLRDGLESSHIIDISYTSVTVVVRTTSRGEAALNTTVVVGGFIEQEKT